MTSGSELATQGDGLSGIQIQNEGAGVAAAMTREQAEIQAAMVMAKRFPRDEKAAGAKIIESCQRRTMAEVSQYAFPRGGTTVKGPSVNLAREAARCWGNVRYGIRIVSEDRDQMHIKGFCLDCETNTLVEVEDTFKKLVFRKVGGWVKPDERDLRELLMRRGAILVRNAILQVLPPDVIEEACAEADRTIRAAIDGAKGESRDTQIRRLIVGFSRLGVTSDMIAEKLGHRVSAMSPDEMAELRPIWKSIDDGNSRREEHFVVADATGDDQQSRTKKLGKELSDKKPKPAPKDEAPSPLAEASALRKKIKDLYAVMMPSDQESFLSNVGLESIIDVEGMAVGDLKAIAETL